jgi:hypothetical protein
MKSLLSFSLVAGLLLLSACSARPLPEPQARTARDVPLQPSWLKGGAKLFHSLEEPSFSVLLRLRLADLARAAPALGINSPCFTVALVERCDNGIMEAAIPRSFTVQPAPDSVGLVPVWCPAVGTAFAWSAEFTDYRRVIGNPGSFYQPLMRCRGRAQVAFFLFPSPLRSDPSVLSQPGVPLDGLPLTQWSSL